MNIFMKKRVLSKVLSLTLAFVLAMGLMGSVVFANPTNGWAVVEGGNLAFYQNGVRVGQGSGPNGHFALALVTPYGTADFFFNNEGHLVRGLVSYGGAWHYFDSTHGTRLLSAIEGGWWGWGLEGRLFFLHADGTKAVDEMLTVEWICNYGDGSLSVATYLFDADGFLITDFDFDLAGGLSVHSAFGEWHVMATNSFNRVANFNDNNGGGWLQTSPGNLRYLVEDGTYLTGPAVVVNGQTIIPEGVLNDAFTTVPTANLGFFACAEHGQGLSCDPDCRIVFEAGVGWGFPTPYTTPDEPIDPDDCHYFHREFLFCVDGYLQFDWVFMGGTRVAYMGTRGYRVSGVHTTGDNFEIDFKYPGASPSDWEILSPTSPHPMTVSLNPDLVTMGAGDTEEIRVTVNRAGYTGALRVTAVPDWIGGPITVLPGAPFSNQVVHVTVPAMTLIGDHEVVFIVTPVNPDHWYYRAKQTLDVRVDTSSEHHLWVDVTTTGSLPHTATVEQTYDLRVELLINRDGYEGALVVDIECDCGQVPSWLPFTSIPVPVGGNFFQVFAFDMMIPRTAMPAWNPHGLTFTVRAASGASHIHEATTANALYLTVIENHAGEHLFSLDVTVVGEAAAVGTAWNNPLEIRQNTTREVVFTIDRGAYYTGPVDVFHNAAFLESPIRIPAGSNSVTRTFGVPWYFGTDWGVLYSTTNTLLREVVFTARAVDQSTPVGPTLTSLWIEVDAIDDEPYDLTLSVSPIPTWPRVVPGHPFWGATFNMVNRNETIPIRLQVNRGGYTGPLVVTADQDWAGGPWVIPAGSSLTPLMNLVMPNPTGPDWTGLDVMPFGGASIPVNFTVNSATADNFMPNPVASDAELIPFELVSRLSRVVFPDDWVGSSLAMDFRVDDENDIIAYLDNLAGGANNWGPEENMFRFINDQERLVAPHPTDGYVRWIYMNEDNPGHRDFDDSSGATNVFRWYVPTFVIGQFGVDYRGNPLVVPAATVGYPNLGAWGFNAAFFSGTITVTNAFNQLEGFGIELRDPDFEIQMTNLAADHTCAITYLTNNYSFIRINTTLGPWGHCPDAIVQWSWVGGTFNPTSGATNTLRWEVVDLAPGISPGGIPLTGTISVQNMEAWLIIPVTFPTVPNVTLPGVAQDPHEIAYYMNNYAAPITAQLVTNIPMWQLVGPTGNNYDTATIEFSWNAANDMMFDWTPGGWNNDFGWSVEHTMHPGIAIAGQPVGNFAGTAGFNIINFDISMAHQHHSQLTSRMAFGGFTNPWFMWDTNSMTNAMTYLQGDHGTTHVHVEIGGVVQPWDPAPYTLGGMTLPNSILADWSGVEAIEWLFIAHDPTVGSSAIIENVMPGLSFNLGAPFTDFNFAPSLTPGVGGAGVDDHTHLFQWSIVNRNTMGAAVNTADPTTTWTGWWWLGAPLSTDTDWGNNFIFAPLSS